MPLWTGQPLAYPTVQKTGAAAEERAAEATLEVARLRAPRLLNAEQQARIVDKMHSFAGQRASVGAVPPTFEAATFAEQILRILKGANINADLNQGAAEVQVGLAHGVVARYFTFSDKGKELAQAFAAALNDEGILCTAVNGLMEVLIKNREEKQNSSLNKSDSYIQWVIIVIGDKI